MALDHSSEFLALEELLLSIVESLELTSSCGHLVCQSGTIWRILAEGIMRNMEYRKHFYIIILILDKYIRCCVKSSIVAPKAVLFNRAEPVVQVCKRPL